MNKLVVADVHTNMAYVAAAGIETEQVTGLQIRGVNMDAVSGLVGGYAVKSVTELAVNIVHEAGTVKTGGGIFSAPAVVIANKLQSIVGNLTAGGSAAGAGVGILAFLNIAGVDKAALAIIGDGSPIAALAGDGDSIAVVQLGNDLRRGGGSGAETDIVTVYEAGLRSHVLNYRGSAGCGGRSLLRLSGAAGVGGGRAEAHISGENKAFLAVNNTLGPFSAVTHNAQFLANIISTEDRIIGTGAGAEADIVTGDKTALCLGVLHLGSGNRSGLRLRFGFRADDNNAIGRGTVVIAAHIGIALADIAGVNIAGLAVNNTANPTVFTAQNLHLLANIVLAQNGGGTVGAGAEADIHGGNVAGSAAACGSVNDDVVTAGVHNVYVTGGHEAGDAVIADGIPVAIGTVGNCDGCISGKAGNHRIVYAGTRPNIDITAGYCGILGKAGNHKH